MPRRSRGVLALSACWSRRAAASAVADAAGASPCRVPGVVQPIGSTRTRHSAIRPPRRREVGRWLIIGPMGPIGLMGPIQRTAIRRSIGQRDLECLPSERGGASAHVECRKSGGGKGDDASHARWVGPSGVVSSKRRGDHRRPSARKPHGGRRPGRRNTPPRARRKQRDARLSGGHPHRRAA